MREPRIRVSASVSVSLRIIVRARVRDRVIVRFWRRVTISTRSSLLNWESLPFRLEVKRYVEISALRLPPSIYHHFAAYLSAAPAAITRASVSAFGERRQGTCFMP